jgi:hypothetical protein
MRSQLPSLFLDESMRPLRKAAKQFRTFICIAAWRVLSSLRFSFIVSTEPKNKLDRLPAACDDHRNQLGNTLGGSSMLDKGVCAEVRVGREHLRLFSEQNALGVQVSVYNVNAKKWIAPSESVETIEQGKLKAATYAETYLRQVANLELPPLKWKESRAA